MRGFSSLVCDNQLEKRCTGNLGNLANIQTQNSHMRRFNLPSSSLKNEVISQSLGVLREQ